MWRLIKFVANGWGCEPCGHQTTNQILTHTHSLCVGLCVYVRVSGLCFIAWHLTFLLALRRRRLITLRAAYNGDHFNALSTLGRWRQSAHRKGRQQQRQPLDCSKMQLKYAFEFYCIALGAPKIANFMREQLIKQQLEKDVGSAAAKWIFAP